MMVKKTARRWVLTVCVTCLMFTVTLTGCEPLRKKFVRQKKKDKTVDDKFVPVLEPEVYEVKQKGPFDEYSQQYMLFNVWISDFGDNFQTTENDKRLISDLDAALKSISIMEKLSTGALVETIVRTKKQVEYLRGEYNQPSAFRNTSRMSSEVRSIERSLRKELKPDLIKDMLIVE